MIKRLFNKQILLNSRPSHSVVSAAFVITVAGLGSRILGLIRDRFLASTFGAGDTLDVYYAAFRVPDFIYNIFILGALSAAFIPVFTSLLSHDKEEEAWDMANGILNLIIIAIVIFSILFFAFAPVVMKLVAPGFPLAKQEQVVLFTRIMFLSPILLGISGIFGGVLTSCKRFLVYSLAPVFYNLGIIVGVTIFVRLMGPVGLAWGVVFGAFLHMMVQIPATYHLGFRHRWVLRSYLANKNIQRVFLLMIPRTLGIAISQINLFVMTIFASLLSSGSLAIFNFAQNLQSVPLGIFGISFSIAVFPTLSTLFAKEDRENFVATFSETFRQILFFVIPLSVFMLLLRAQLVRVVLGAGNFDWEDTTLTFQVLGIFTLSLFAQSVVPLLARAFYAMHDTKTPFYIAIVTEIVNITALVMLISRYQLLGLAMAFSLSSITQMLLLLFMLRSKFDALDDKKIMQSITRISFASIAAGVGVQTLKHFLATQVDMDTFIGVFIQLIGSGAIGILIYLIACHIIGLDEYLYFKNSLGKRLFRGKKVIVEDTGEVSGM